MTENKTDKDQEIYNREDHDDLKTFDMYSCFSRWDVILAIVLTLFLLIILSYVLFSGETV